MVSSGGAGRAATVVAVISAASPNSRMANGEWRVASALAAPTTRPRTSGIATRHTLYAIRLFILANRFHCQAVRHFFRHSELLGNGSRRVARARARCAQRHDAFAHLGFANCYVGRGANHQHNLPSRLPLLIVRSKLTHRSSAYLFELLRHFARHHGGAGSVASLLELAQCGHEAVGGLVEDHSVT